MNMRPPRSTRTDTRFPSTPLFRSVWFGRRKLQGIGRPIAGEEQKSRVLWVLLGAIVAIPLIYFLLAIDASNLQWVLSALFVGLCAMIMMEGVRDGPVARDKALAMLIIFAFNVLFWMFFKQAGSSFNFLADKIVDIGRAHV